VLADELPGYFDLYGWRYERRDPQIFRTGFSGDSGSYDIWVRVADPVIIFIITPYALRPTTPDKDGDDVQRPAGATLLRALLTANHELNLAKFGIDDDGDLCLSVEMPSEGFSYTHFSDALTALSHYADELCGRVAEAITADAEEIV
jgi:hypothetical protein